MHVGLGNHGGDQRTNDVGRVAARRRRRKAEVAGKDEEDWRSITIVQHTNRAAGAASRSRGEGNAFPTEGNNGGRGRPPLATAASIRLNARSMSGPIGAQVPRPSATYTQPAPLRAAFTGSTVVVARTGSARAPATLTPRRKVDAARTFVLGKQQACDHETRQGEDDRYSHEPTGQPVDVEVDDDDSRDR